MRCVFVCLLSVILSVPVIAQDGPTTPVPPIPTDSELFAAGYARLQSLNTEIAALEADIRVREVLLSRTPPGPLADELRASLVRMRARLVQLKTERQWLIQFLGGLNP